MSRRINESFDFLTPTQLGQTGKWEYVGSGVVSTTGRTDNGVTGTAGGDNRMRSRPITPALRTGIPGYHGFAIKHTGLPSSEAKLWTLIGDDGAVQITVSRATNGTVKVYSGTMETGDLLGQSPLTFFSTSFRYLEIGHILTSGGGRVEVRSIPASGTPRVLVVAGGLTTHSWKQIDLYLTEEIVVDDFYINDTSAPTPGFFSGDSTIQARKVIDVTNEFDASLIGTFQWRPNTGPNTAAGKVAAVDDDPYDGDATYIYTRHENSTIEFQAEAVTPDDGRQVVDVQLTGIFRKTFSGPPPAGAPIRGALGLRRWDGVQVSLKDEDDLLVGTGYQAMCSMTHQPGWTIERVNDSRWYCKS